MLAQRSIRPYVTQSLKITLLAPRAFAICGIKIKPITERKTPTIITVFISIEKYSLAFCFLPSPSVLATIALPPVPTRNPIEPSAIRTGITRFTAAKAFLPTMFDTKIPSTIL